MPNDDTANKIQEIADNVEQSHYYEKNQPVEMDQIKVVKYHIATEALNIIQSMKIRIFMLCLLIYLLVGTLIYPYWWYMFFFRGGMFNIRQWQAGVIFLAENFIGTIIITFLVIIAALVAPATSLLYLALNKLRSACFVIINGKLGLILLGALFACLMFSLFMLEGRSARDIEYEKERARYMARETQRIQDMIARRDPDQGQPLTEPKIFYYISKEDVESLYGQYEPDLIPQSIVEEIKNTNEFKAAGSIEDFLKIEAGNDLLKRKLTEYKQSVKTPERKFRDIVQFLYSNKLLKRYRNLRTDSTEIAEFDQAFHLLTQKYGLIIDKQQVRLLRDKMLGREISKLESDLRDIRGYLLVEGKWEIESQLNTYKFRRPFMEEITSPPICEVTINKTHISEKHRDIIERSKDSSIQLSIIGNVVTGMTEPSKTVYLNPIGIF